MTRLQIQWIFLFIINLTGAEKPYLKIDSLGNISFATQIGLRYELVESTNLVDWDLVNNWDCKTDGVVDYKISFGDSPQKFYKVVVKTLSDVPNKKLYDEGFFVWRMSRGLPEKLKLSCLESVVIASLLENGGVELITHGTLTQRIGSWNYDQFPEDRLVVQTFDSKLEFLIQEIQGDFRRAYTFAFLRSPHILEFEVKDLISGIFEFDTKSTFLPTNNYVKSDTFGILRNSIGNQYTVSIVETTKNLTQINDNGANYGSPNMVGNGLRLNYESEQQLEINAKGNDFEFHLIEHRNYRSVYFDHFIENSRRSIEGKWENSENSFEVDGFNVNTALKDTFAVDLETYWQVEGNVLFNGSKYAQISQRRVDTEKASWQEIFTKSPYGDQVIEVYPLKFGN